MDCLLEDETISGAKIEQLMDAHPPDPQLIDVSDWTVRRLLNLSHSENMSSLPCRLKSLSCDKDL